MVDMAALHLVETQRRLITSMEKGSGRGWSGLHEWQLFQWSIVQRNKRQHSLIIEGQRLEKVSEGSPLNSPLWDACHSLTHNLLAQALILNSTAFW